jgi:hypothetical protein
MASILHILTQPDDSFARKILECQSQGPEKTVVVVELTRPDPDYEALLDRILEADSIQVW